MSRVSLIDLHVHTDASPDSSLTVREAVLGAKDAGLTGFAVTDHNTMSAIPSAMLLAAREGLLVIAGVEVSTREGHLLAYGVPKPPEKDRPFLETVDEVHSMGGIAVLAHPFRFFHGAGRKLEGGMLTVDGIEILNGHTDVRANERARVLSVRSGLPGIGGSDAHRPGDLGACFTEFPCWDPAVGLDLKRNPPVAKGRGLNLRGKLVVGIGNAGKRTRRGLKPL